MSRYFSIVLISIIVFGISFGAVRKTKVPKNERMTYKMERDPSNYETLGRGSTKITMPNTRNDGFFTLIDSSTNGYGMVAANTRPLFVDPENTGFWFMAYRQYAGENTTHGQLGGAFSEDGDDWQSYPNLNSNGSPPWGGGGVGGSGVGQARYPSAIGTEDMPVAVWNEYTGITTFGSAYGGRPYFAYDEFGWDGGSFAYPIEGDLLWETDAKDLWVGSTSVSYDDDLGMPVINTVYNDWTRGDRWLFHSEYVDGEVIIMGEEQKVIDEVNDLVGGDDTGSYNTSPYVSCTPEGICGVGVVGLFLGADSDASDISNNHTGIFKMSEDHGMSWHGCDGTPGQGCAPSTDGDNYYFIPDAVWNDLVATQFNYEYVDECEGTSVLIDSFWSYYEDDFKVDREGNPHWTIQVLGCDSNPEGFCYYVPESGIYHFTIDRDYLDNPGPVNTPTGWNWSFVITGNDTWGFSDMTGDTYIWNNHSALAFSIDDSDVLYVVSNMATTGDWTGTQENYDDPCYLSEWSDYANWSEDIYVIKSEDGGQTWWNPLNVTNTPDETDGDCPNGYPKCDPAEEFPHTAQWATNDQVNLMYQMPNWAFNEIGDLLGADFMNRVYGGYAIVDDSDIPEYGTGGSGCYAELGDVNGDSILNILDIIEVVNFVLGNSTIDDQCASDYNADGITNILDIIEMVNYVLGNARIVEQTPANEAKLNINTKLNSLSVIADGYIQAIQVTVEHTDDFSIAMNNELYIAESQTSDSKTIILVVTDGENLAKVASIAQISGDIDNITISEAYAYSIDSKEIVVELSRDASEDDFASMSALPNGYRLSNAYPNPFNPTTTFKVDLDNQMFVSIKAYNIVGQLVAEVFNGDLSGYDNKIDWNASSIASGIYFMKIQVGDHLESQKVLLVK